MKEAIEDAYHAEDKICNVKYIDPSYMIRSDQLLNDGRTYTQDDI